MLVFALVLEPRQWFIIGVTNIMFSVYILGAFPNLYYLFFTPKVLSLIIVRLVKFYRKKQHFLLHLGTS